MFHKLIFSINYIQAATARFITMAVRRQRHWLIHIIHVFSFDRPDPPYARIYMPSRTSTNNSSLHLIEPDLQCCSKSILNQTSPFHLGLCVKCVWTLESLILYIIANPLHTTTNFLEIYGFIRPVAHSTTAGCNVSLAHVVLVVILWLLSPLLPGLPCCCLPSGIAMKSSKLLPARVCCRFLILLLPLSCCYNVDAATRLLQLCCFFGGCSGLMNKLAAFVAVDNTSAVEVEYRLPSSSLLFD